MIVYTGGTFDLFHSGHVRLLKRCRDLAGDDGEVVVSVNPSEFVSAYKEPPICDLFERMEVALADANGVDRFTFYNANRWNFVSSSLEKK